MQIRSRYTGELQSNVMAFANFEKQTQAEKANAIVGPALGAAAAATAVMMGMQQVRQIKSQQPAGIARGGMDYVPNESTYILQRGERFFRLNKTLKSEQWHGTTTLAAKVEQVAAVLVLVLRMKSLSKVQ